MNKAASSGERPADTKLRCETQKVVLDGSSESHTHTHD